MAVMLGEDGHGYELARRLECSGVWRPWLGDDGEYEALQSHLASPASWAAFMGCSTHTSPSSPSPSPSRTISLQLRVRALLYDKACLLLDSSMGVAPSSLDSSYLQLHADNVYFSLEQDIKDWAQLQVEGSPAITPLQAKLGLDMLVACGSAENFHESNHDMESKHVKPLKTQNVTRCVASPYADRSNAILSRSSVHLGAEGGDGISENKEERELWYDRWLAKNSFERMQRLAWRIAQQKLPFKERDSCQRTSHGMATYLSCLERVQRLRCSIKSEVKSLPERAPVTTDEDIEFFPEVMFPWNCVPDVAVFPNKRPLSDQNNHCLGGILDKLQTSPVKGPWTFSNIVHDGSNSGSGGLNPTIRRLDGMQETHGNFRTIARRKEIFEEVAQHSFKELVVRIVSGYGFQGLKQSAIEILVQLATCHICSLGSILRTLLDNYRTHYSQKDLLKMFIRKSGCRDLAALMEYVKAGIRQSAQQQLLLRNNQMQQLPAQAQFQQTVFQVQQDSMTPQQMMLQRQNLMIQQQQLKRRQALTPRTSQHSPLSAQQHQAAWQQQQQLMQLTQTHHPHVMQQLKQLSTFQPMSVASSKPHVKVEALHELIGTEGTAKQEAEDDRDGIIASPSKRRAK